jgi:hypothetical protein
MEVNCQLLARPLYLPVWILWWNLLPLPGIKPRPSSPQSVAMQTELSRFVYLHVLFWPVETEEYHKDDQVVSLGQPKYQSRVLSTRLRRCNAQRSEERAATTTWLWHGNQIIVNVGIRPYNLDQISHSVMQACNYFRLWSMRTQYLQFFLCVRVGKTFISSLSFSWHWIPEIPIFQYFHISRSLLRKFIQSNRSLNRAYISIYIERAE